MALALAPGARPDRPVNAIVFDVDGVLWDTRQSYDQAIFQTVDHVMGSLERTDLQGCLSPSDLRLMRRAGRLNSDWDLTYVLVSALLAGYADMAEAARATAGQGVAWAWASRGPAARLEFDIIKRWFDCVYWGHADFVRFVGPPAPPLPPQPGTWRQETPFVAPDDFARLQALGVSALGIATGRPQLELQTVLDNSPLQQYIPRAHMCTGDVLAKPDPQVMAWCVDRMRASRAQDAPPVSSVLYCGDTRDDVQLVLNYRAWPARAPRAGLWLGAVAVVPEDEFDFFLRAGADACIDHVSLLPATVEALNERVITEP